MARIIVIGAGVIGLTTALQLQSKGHNVTIVAKWFPGENSIEYTSPWAGAHWRTMAPNSDKRLQNFDAVTYRKFMQWAKARGQETGIMIVPSSDYYDEETPETVDPWFKDLVLDFQFIPKNELPPNAKVGHRYTTVVINAPYYIKWLLSEFQRAGGRIKRQTLTHINNVFDVDADAIVSCTGLGAKTLGGVQDTSMFPTRGQTIVVKGPKIRETTTHVGKDYITYVIPRADGTVVLGGTMQKNQSDAQPDEATAKDIYCRVKALAPHITKELEPLEIVRHSVGLRPTRVEGPRIENQVYTYNGKKITVTHAYGHGGFGYQSSWGSAEYTVSLVERGLKDNAKL